MVQGVKRGGKAAVQAEYLQEADTQASSMSLVWVALSAVKLLAMLQSQLTKSHPLQQREKSSLQQSCMVSRFLASKQQQQQASIAVLSTTAECLPRSAGTPKGMSSSRKALIQLQGQALTWFSTSAVRGK